MAVLAVSQLPAPPPESDRAEAWQTALRSDAASPGT